MGYEHHGGYAERRGKQLLFEIISGILKLHISVIGACTVKHDQPEHRKDTYQHKQRDIRASSVLRIKLLLRLLLVHRRAPVKAVLRIP